MSKTKRIRVDFDDTSELLDLILILKDIATNMFQRSAKKKQILIDFVTYFIDFFKIASFVGIDHPLIKPKTDVVAILAITSESPFMGDMNSRMVRALITEMEKANATEIILVGQKVTDKVKSLVGRSKNIKVFGNLSKFGHYKVSLMVKDYIIEKVLSHSVGKVVAVFPFALNINLIKPRVAVLFPSTDMFAEHQAQDKPGLEAKIESVTVESNIDEILGYLASVWLTCRIYELLMNSESSSFAAQVQQLDSASDRLKKEKLFLGMALRKSRKADISKSLAELFASKMMTSKGHV